MGRSELREEFYSDVLSDAGSACYYWWYDHDGDPLPAWGSLTTNDVARGWQRLIKVEREGGFMCCGDPRAVRRSEAALSQGTDDADYDACVADAVIQLALFGKIIYG